MVLQAKWLKPLNLQSVSYLLKLSETIRVTAWLPIIGISSALQVFRIHSKSPPWRLLTNVDWFVCRIVLDTICQEYQFY